MRDRVEGDAGVSVRAMLSFRVGVEDKGKDRVRVGGWVRVGLG